MRGIVNRGWIYQNRFLETWGENIWLLELIALPVARGVKIVEHISYRRESLLDTLQGRETLHLHLEKLSSYLQPEGPRHCRTKTRKMGLPVGVLVAIPSRVFICFFLRLLHSFIQYSYFSHFRFHIKSFRLGSLYLPYTLANRFFGYRIRLFIFRYVTFRVLRWSVEHSFSL